MRIERVVVNASPIICLSKSGLIDLLLSLFTEIIVPDKVYKEIIAKGEIDPSSIPLFSSKQFNLNPA
jgi:predicted nucleic acid-binding protein